MCSIFGVLDVRQDLNAVHRLALVVALVIARLKMQVGIAIRTGRAGQRYRLALEYVNGRSLLGEFSMHDESTLGLGWFYDF